MAQRMDMNANEDEYDVNDEEYNIVDLVEHE